MERVNWNPEVLGRRNSFYLEKNYFVVDVCLFSTVIFKRRVERKMLLKATMTSKMATVPSSTVFEKWSEADCSSNVPPFHSYYSID